MTPISKVKSILGYKARTHLATMLKDATRLRFVADLARAPSSTADIKTLVATLSALTPAEIRNAVRRGETRRRMEAAKEARQRGTQDRTNRTVAKEVRRIITAPAPATPPAEYTFQASGIGQVVDVIRHRYDNHILRERYLIGARRVGKGPNGNYDMWATLSPAFTKALYEFSDRLGGGQGEAEKDRLETALNKFFGSSPGEPRGFVYNQFGGESDEDTQFVIEENTPYDIVITNFEERQAMLDNENNRRNPWTRPSGEFFPYHVDATKFGGYFTPFTEDLARFGIYANFTEAARSVMDLPQEEHKEKLKMIKKWKTQQGLPCLYRAMEVAGLSKPKLDIMKTLFLRRRINRCNLEIFAVRAGVHIVCHDPEGKNTLRFGDPARETVHICKSDGHYIPHDTRTISARFALDNHEAAMARGKPEWWTYTSAWKCDSAKTRLTPYSLIQRLKEIPGALIPITVDTVGVFDTSAWTLVDRNGVEKLNEIDELTCTPVGEDSVITLTEKLDEEAKEAILEMSEDDFFKSVQTSKDFQQMKKDLVNHCTTTHYRFAKGKTYGRLFAPGVQRLCGAIRGLVMRHTTDIDMSACHPRILDWVCDNNGIDCPVLKRFLADREGFYRDVSTDKKKAKKMVLTIVNDNNGREESGVLGELQQEMVKVRLAIDGLEQYKHIAGSDAKGNRLGSKMNLVLCEWERRMVMHAMMIVRLDFNLEPMVLMHDGFMVGGDHYSREVTICTRLQDALMVEFKINMPWTMKAHNTSLHHLVKTKPPNDHTCRAEIELEVLYNAGQTDLVELERLREKWALLDFSHKQMADECRALKNSNTLLTVALDFEACTDGAKHKAYCVCARTNDDADKLTRTSEPTKEEVEETGVKWKPPSVRILAHNMAYDFSFLVNKLVGLKICQDASHFYGGTAFYSNFIDDKKRCVELVFTDTLKYISRPLKEFGAMFKLEQGKEIMPHSLATTARMLEQDGTVTIQELKNCPELMDKPADLEHVLNTMDQLGFTKPDGVYDLMAYSQHYCSIDVDVMYTGIERFRADIKDSLNLEMSPGGRVMCHNNERQKFDPHNGRSHEEIRKLLVKALDGDPEASATFIEDADVNALYPYAQVELADQLGGFLYGEPRVLEEHELNRDFLRTCGVCDVVFRMKGIPGPVVTRHADEYFGGDVMALYQFLYDGNPITFDLRKGHLCFRVHKDNSFFTMAECSRTVHFPLENPTKPDKPDKPSKRQKKLNPKDEALVSLLEMMTSDE